MAQGWRDPGEHGASEGEGRQARDHPVYAERLGALPVRRSEQSRHGPGHRETRHKAFRWVPSCSSHSASFTDCCMSVFRIRHSLILLLPVSVYIRFALTGRYFISDGRESFGDVLLLLNTLNRFCVKHIKQSVYGGASTATKVGLGWRITPRYRVEFHMF